MYHTATFSDNVSDIVPSTSPCLERKGNPTYLTLYLTSRKHTRSSSRVREKVIEIDRESLLGSSVIAGKAEAGTALQYDSRWSSLRLNSAITTAHILHCPWSPCSTGTNQSLNNPLRANNYRTYMSVFLPA